MWQLSISIRIVLLCLLCIKLSDNQLSAQEYLPYIQKLSLKEGLSNRIINDFAQDKTGFIWIGTRHGLNRYDGYSFSVYTSDKHGLRSNDVRTIWAGPDGCLWIGYNNTLNNPAKQVDIFCPETERAVPVDSFFKDKFPFTFNELQIRTFEHGLILQNDKYETYLYYGDGKFVEVTGHDFDPDDNSNEITYAVPSSFESTWVSAYPSILEIGHKGDVISHIEIDSSRFAVHSIVYADSSNNLWVVYTLAQEEKKQSVLRFGKVLSDGSVEGGALLAPDGSEIIIDWGQFYDVIYDKERNCFWEFGNSYEYIFSFDIDRNIIQDYSKSIPLYEQVTRNITQNQMIDRNGNLLFYAGEELWLVNLTKNKFSQFLTTDAKSQRHSCRAIIELDDGNLLINSYHGMFIVNPITKTNTPIIIPEYGGDVITSHFAAKIPNSDKLLLCSPDSEDPIHRGIFIYDLETKEVQPINHENLDYQRPYHPDAVLPWSLGVGINNKYWVGYNKGISTYTLGDPYIQRFKQYGDYPELEQQYIFHFNRVKNGFWISTSIGLYFLDDEKGITTRYSAKDEGNNYIPFDNVQYSYIENDTSFWLATRGGGLIHMNPYSDYYKHYTTSSSGLSHDMIYSIYEDDYKNFWIPSDYGLMQFNKETKFVNVYLPENGTAHEEYNITSSHVGRNGRLYFGGLNGVIAFYPQDFIVQSQEENSPLVVTNFERFDGRMGEIVNETMSLRDNKNTIELHHSDRFFTIEFALLNYKDPKGNQYAYKLEGYDEDWTIINENFLRINNLPYGDYTLRIKAKGSNREWKERTLDFKILAYKPFYLTWPFLISSVFVIVVVVGGGVRLRLSSLKRAKEQLEEEVKKRTKKIEQQTEELRELDKAKSRFFANVSHELRTPLTLILGPLKMFLEKYKGGEKPASRHLEIAIKNGTQLRTRITEILDLSKLESHKLTLDEAVINLQSLANYMHGNFESQASVQQIELILDYDAPQNWQLMMDEDKVRKVLTNLLSNALKHTPPQGKVIFSVKKRKGFLDIKVSDTGAGIHPDDLPFIFDRFYQSKRPDAVVQGGTGIGLALSKELARLMGGGLFVESQLNVGSTFTLEIPYKLAESQEIGPEYIPSTADVFIEEEMSSETVETTEITSILDADGNKKHRVLIVEDNDDMRSYIMDILAPYFILEAKEHGGVAWEYLQSEEADVDLILSDVMMPVMDGFEFLERVKKDKKWSTTPMVMLTARADQPDKLNALRIGVDDYLTKPFEPKELAIRLQNLLRNAIERKAEIQAIRAETSTEKANTQKNEQIDTATTKVEEEMVETPAIPVEEDVNALLEVDQKWLEMVEQIVLSYLDNNNFGVTSLAMELNMSERNLRRRLKICTGLSPIKYIREIKLHAARQFLEKGRYKTIREVAFAIGITDTTYFSKLYEKQYGKKPKEYLKY